VRSLYRLFFQLFPTRHPNKCLRGQHLFLLLVLLIVILFNFI
jgi:hypothetical protein